MILNLISIGNSKGIRLPKSIVNELNIENEVELNIKDGKIELRPVNRSVRSGWDEAFSQMNENQDDTLLIADIMPTTDEID